MPHLLPQTPVHQLSRALRPCPHLPRAAIILTLFVTLTALQFVANFTLPASSYLSPLSKLIIVSYVFLATLAIKSSLLYHSHYKSREELEEAEREQLQLTQLETLNAHAAAMNAHAVATLAALRMHLQGDAGDFSGVLTAYDQQQQAYDQEAKLEVAEDVDVSEPLAKRRCSRINWSAGNAIDRILAVVLFVAYVIAVAIILTESS